jgi:hypothetical protein
MTRSLLSWMRRPSGWTPARRLTAPWLFAPRLLLLEDRTLPSVQFTPAPYSVPANRQDTPVGHIDIIRFEEPYLSVNPADPGDIAVSSGNGMRVSMNAGGGFSGGARFSGSSGDTSSTYDSAGRLFWVNLLASGGVGIAQVDPINGGIISTHVVDQPDTGFGDDKDWIAADPSNNNLYVVWIGFRLGGAGHVMMRYSSDQGTSWSPPVQVDNGNDNYDQDPTVTVAPDHHVYAAYHSVSCIDQPDCLSGRFVASHDNKVVVVRLDNDLSNPVRSIAEVPGRADITLNIQTAGFPRQIPGATFLTAGSQQPWVLTDPVRPGNIYVISADSNNGFHQDYGDIRLARSTNYGMTWSSSLIETSSALFPNAAIDQNGDLVVSWYDNRRGLTNAAGHFKLDVYATYSTDGGLTFAPAFPVNDQTPGVNTPNGNTFDPDPGAVISNPGPPPTTRIGEYFGLGISGGTAYVAWNGNQFAGFDRPVNQQTWLKAFAIRGSLTATGTDDSDDIIIRSVAENPDFVEVLVDGKRQYAGLWSALTGITINATPGNDVIEIDNTAAGTPVTINEGNGTDAVHISPIANDLDTIQGPVIVYGGSGSDTLNILDESNAASTTYTVTGSSASRPASATISYTNTNMGILGGNGNDAFNVLGILPRQVNLNPGFGSNTVTIDDRPNTASTTYTITGSTVARAGSGTLTYCAASCGAVADLVITGGSGDNIYNVVGTRSLTPTTLNTGNGTDTVNVQNTAEPLFINNGGSAAITLSNSAATLGGIGHVIINDPSKSAAATVDDSSFAGSTTYTLTSTQVAVAAWPNFLLVYNNLASLNLDGGSGDDSFAIESTASATATTVTAGSGGNRFDLTPTAQYLAGVAGPLNLLGGGADTLVFWDTANPSAETYTFDDIPSMLALATVPAFAASWSGMAAVYLETNHMSTVNDPSGTVLVDVLPPGPADTAQQPPMAQSLPAADALVQALFDVVQERDGAVWGAPCLSDALVADRIGYGVG